MSPNIAKSTRRHDLDWLRMVAVLLLIIPFHSARVFDVSDPFYVKNAQTSEGLSWVVAFLNPWQLPLLFVLAGAAAWFALGHRSPRLVPHQLLGAALLGTGRALLNLDSPVLRYTSEASFPVYLVHQTVIVGIAYAVVGWDMGVWPKFAVVMLSSFAVSLLLYEYVIRRTDATRFLFGMRHRPLERLR